MRSPAGPIVVLATLLVLVLATGCGDDDPQAATAAPVATDDPARTFAPLAHLHEREGLFPISAEDFIDHGNLTWADMEGIDTTIATGRGRGDVDLEKVPDLRAEKLGLGPKPYRFAPEAQNRSRCEGCPPKTYSTTQLTRPFQLYRSPELRPRDGYYIDLLTEWLDGVKQLEREDGQVVLRDAVAYYETKPESADGRPGLRITYWLPFGRHRPAADYITTPFNHEGDWERVSVLLQRAGTDRYVPISVRFHLSMHGRDVPWRAAPTRDAAWDSVRKARAPGETRATHPVAYLGNGSHTPYAAPVSRTMRVVTPTIFKVTNEAKACPRCPQWRTWEHLRDASKQPWYGYGGAWGYVFRTDGSSGPLGPSRYPR